jgi:hypothetical protein
MNKRTIGLALGVIAVIAGLILINHNLGSGVGAQPDDDDAPAQSSSQPAKSTPPPPPPGGASSGQALTPELTIGNPKTAATRVTLGYTVDDNVAQHTSDAAQAISAAQSWAQSHPQASLQVVCVDIPPSMRDDPTTANVPVGLTVNGKPPAGPNGNIGPGGLTASAVVQDLSAVSH